MRVLRPLLVLVGLWLAYLVLFLGGTAVLGPTVDPASLTPAEQSAAGRGALLMAALDLAIVGTWIHRSRTPRGLGLWAMAAGLLYGVKTFSSQLEVWYFVQTSHVPPDMLPRLFVMTLPLCLVWPALAVWGLGPRVATPAPAAPSGRALLARVLIAGALVYPVLFFTFGYGVAWRVPEVRAYYGGPETPLPFLTHMGALFASDPGVIPFEMARGLLWIALGWPVLRGTRGPWWVGTALYAAMLALVQNDVHLLPNPLMPPVVRYWHFIETASSNAIFAGVAGFLVARPARAGA